MDLPQRFAAAISDRYRVERELGAGGMATVYLAHDIRHDREVAIKVLKPELGAVLGTDRFLAEIKVTASLQHPNILPLFDSGKVQFSSSSQDSGLTTHVYYVMPYIDGESLRERLDSDGPLPVGEAVRLAAEVAEALEHAHRHGVVHRDIKPENILLLDGRAVVADFGIALEHSTETESGRLTGTGISLGTPTYMSPEQALGVRELDFRVDIYAIGVLLYEMLAGVPPFTGPNAQAIVAQVITGSPPPLSRYRSDVPAAVEQVVRRALAKQPDDRFDSTAELRTALLTADPTVAPTRRRIPVVAMVVALVILVAALLLVRSRNGDTAARAGVIGTGHPADTAAVRLVSEGSDWLERRNTAACSRAKTSFADATGHDSMYARAYAGMAEAYALCALFGAGDPRTAYIEARTFADRALGIDSLSANAYTSRGMASLFSEQDWAAADHDFRRAIALDSTLASTRLFRTWYFIAMGQLDSAEASVRYAKVLAPTSDIIGTRLGTVLRYRGRWNDALGAINEVLARDSSDVLAREELMEYYLDRGDCAAARSAVDWVVEHHLIVPGQPESRFQEAVMTAVQVRCDDPASGVRYLRVRKADEAAGKYVDPFALAIVQATMGDRSAALASLERAVAEHSWELFFLPRFFAFRPYHDDPRFLALLKRLDLPSAG